MKFRTIRYSFWNKREREISKNLIEFYSKQHYDFTP